MPNLILEAILSQMGEDFDMPIFIVPSSMLKKKKMEDNVEEETLGTRLNKVERTPTTVMPSPTPG